MYIVTYTYAYAYMHTYITFLDLGDPSSMFSNKSSPHMRAYTHENIHNTILLILYIHTHSWKHILNSSHTMHTYIHTHTHDLPHTGKAVQHIRRQQQLSYAYTHTYQHTYMKNAMYREVGSSRMHTYIRT
jgi:hypothetical protein